MDSIYFRELDGNLIEVSGYCDAARQRQEAVRVKAVARCADAGVAWPTHLVRNALKSLGRKLFPCYRNPAVEQLGPSTCDEVLSSQLIDAHLLHADDWAGFLRESGERVDRLIAAATGGEVRPFGETRRERPARRR